MVGGAVAGDFTGCLGLGNGGAEITPFIVAEQVLEVAGQPILDAAFGLLGVSFKGAREGLDEFGFHVSSISVTLLAIVVSSSRAAALRASSSSFRVSSCSLKSSSLTTSPAATPTYRPGFRLQPWASISFKVAALHKPATSL